MKRKAKSQTISPIELADALYTLKLQALASDWPATCRERQRELLIIMTRAMDLAAAIAEPAR